MSLLNSLKFFKFFLVILLMIAGTMAIANIKPGDNRETDKEEIHNQQVEKDDSGSEAAAKKEGIKNKEETSEKRQVNVSNSSFNYLFFLIYKIKFADIFRLPNRNDEENKLSIPAININSLLEQIINIKF